MGRVAFACWFEDKGFKGTARYRYFKKRKIEADHVWGKKTEQEWQQILAKYDHIFCYNGSHHMSAPYAAAINRLNIPVTYHEGGILPARAHAFMDRDGVLGASSFCKDISWVTDEHMESLAKWKKTYLDKLGISEEEATWKGGEGYIFCPMQCHWDANFNRDNGWSPYTGRDAMQQFIVDIQKKRPDDRIVFRCHPADIDNLELYKPLVNRGNEIFGSQWDNNVSKYEPELIRMMLNSKEVVGVNTTCLLQSVLMGVPTTALGWGYIKSAGDKHEDKLRMVAAVRHRTHKWNDIEECTRIMEEIHKPGEVFWK